MPYRKLFPEEISQLKQQRCVAIDGWENIHVSHTFLTQNIKEVTFSGVNYLACYSRIINNSHVHDYAGIYHAHLHNCTIKDQAYIKNIGSTISHYIVEENCMLINVASLTVDGENTFGNGITVNPVNEGGGRQVSLYNELSVHTAYMIAFYGDKPKLSARIKEMITDYATKIKSDSGRIQKNTLVMNCGTITNVNIGESCTLEGVTLLKNGTINSSSEAPSYVGHDVNACSFIISSGSVVSDGAFLRHCFVGQGCEIANHYTAENSLFFANSQCLQGEACSIFAGPYTVTHHKSTLLIAGYYSFFNAGSGTNQSNHMYKLGPLHQGVIERGSKTGSDSYVLWPAKIGAFTMILGRHYGNPDSSELPFSYLIEDNGKSVLMAGQNIFSVGTTRDVDKWPQRDKRKGHDWFDYLITDALNPFTINKILKGIEILKQLQDKASPQGKNIMYKNTQIPLTSIKRGIKLYEQALIKYIGDELTSTLKQTNFDQVKSFNVSLNNVNEWIDLGGLVCLKKSITDLMEQIENKEIPIEELNARYASLFSNYTSLKREHAYQVLMSYFQIDLLHCGASEIAAFLQEWMTNNEKILSSITMDAKKEFNAKSTIGYGIDGNMETKEADFRNVRGTAEDNSFLNALRSQFEQQNSEAQKLIESLQ
jgi:hypothetical protein